MMPVELKKMDFAVSQLISGFRVTEVKESTEVQGRAVRMQHEKTGADLFFLDNSAENMVFSITFRTLPEDHTGVFHILEHSVLCGSDRYPVREPFVELLKSSMNTFLNAMTFPDMTMYPVSSRNPRDLMNLAAVYLDAVFRPAVIKDRKRFAQEGWHIDRDEEGHPVYKGVVFNEMKGVMSEADGLIENQLMRQLFPGTCYGFNSGGDPEHIPELTYEQFQAQYRKWYHPSNARIYLDGKVPIEEMLPLIDSYLSAYERRTDFPDFTFQKPEESEATIHYELGQEEEEENRGYLTAARLTGTWNTRAENMARKMICDALTGNNEAPLKRLALERELCQDLSLSVDDTGLQTWVTMQAENVTDGKENDILALLDEYAEQIRENGMDRDALEASLNRLIYHLREEEEPQGIGRCIRVMGTWLYGGDPLDALCTADVVRQVREMMDRDGLEALAVDMLSGREGRVILHTLPSRTLGEERRRDEAARLEQIIGTWSEKEKTDNERLLEDLEAWQSTPDREEDLRALPTLKKSDADVEPEWTETETAVVDGVEVLMHRLPCNGVVHMRFSFRLTDLSISELTEAAFMSSLLGRMPTKGYTALKLQQEIKRYTGSLGFAVSVRARRDQDETCVPYLTAYASALEEYAEKARQLLVEILTCTTWDETDRILEFVQQNELYARQRIAGAGHTIGVKHVLGMYSAEGAAKNALDGEPAFRWIHRFAQSPEDLLPHFLQTVGKIMGHAVGRKRMTASVTAAAPEVPKDVILALPEGDDAPDEAAYQQESIMRTGFRIPAQIGYAVRGYRLSRCGMKFSGIMWLAGSVLSLGYLWNRIRVQGGAYGAGFQTDRAGNVFSYSYRDPTPAKTLLADGEAARFLKEFAERKENLDNYIISSLNELNPLLSPRDKGALADNRYLNHYTREEANRIRREILNATPEQLAACSVWLEPFAREGAVCVVAHEDALDACQDLQVTDL